MESDAITMTSPVDRVGLLTSRMVQRARMALARYSSSFPVMSLVRLQGRKEIISDIVQFLWKLDFDPRVITCS